MLPSKNENKLGNIGQSRNTAQQNQALELEITSNAMLVTIIVCFEKSVTVYEKLILNILQKCFK